ncbi:MAG TPA: aldo/keto reductase [Myxococcaceae bacterium]|nr:aldo/keto reductase [Myxococcaceae bacterium]
MHRRLAAEPPEAAPRSPSAVERPLGRTGQMVLPVSLGGEGVLRTTGRSREAVPVILEALRLGVRYCDTAPAYQQSQDYYGAAFREAGSTSRRSIFLASKTHDRSRDGSLRLLDNSLRRLGTDYLDLWQLHDLRDPWELEEIFGPGGAIEAVERARADGRVRFAGITGHYDPAVLVEAMRRYPFDNVLCAINPADRTQLSFLKTVVPLARRQQIGLVGMKVLGAGRIVADGLAGAPELIRYGASHADTVIIGCWTVEEVRADFAVGQRFTPMTSPELKELEERLAPRSIDYTAYKRLT